MRHFTVLHKIFSNGSFFLKGIRRCLIRIFSVLLFGFITGITLQAQTNIINIGANNTSENITIPISGHTNITDYTIIGTTSVKTITIQSGYEGTITLEDVSITSSRTGLTSGATRGTSTDASCITVLGENNHSNLSPVTRVKFVLKGSNTLTYTEHHYCAIQVNQGAQVHISATDPDVNSSGKLIAQCTATAGTSGGGGAAIGAPNFTQGYGQGKSSVITCNPGSTNSSSTGSNTAGGNIIISSGTIVANGGHAAGIGGGWYTYYNGIILIYGGKVDVTSKRHAAGIGSGCPTGHGIIGCYADNSAIISFPPATVEGYGAEETNTVYPNLALAGAKNTTYINDPNKTEITVHTEDYRPETDIYLDLTQTAGLVDIFKALGLDYSYLKKVRVGRTDTNGQFVFHAQLEQPTTFFTDASSNSNGRPYMPVETTVIGNQGDKRDIELPLLKTNISFTDYPSIPLEVGYTAEQAWKNAHRIKMEYNDNAAMSNLTFRLQEGIASDFTGMKFLDADGITETSAPAALSKNDVYYIVLPIVPGKPVGVYSDVLLIDGTWGTTPLPGYIRRIGQQRVVKDDTGKNEHIKVTASPDKSVFLTSISDKNVDLILNINHTGTGVNYDSLDVKAKYLITTERNYLAAVTDTPINSWTDLNIPGTVNTDKKTIVSFDDSSINKETSYYIHWYVESGVVYAHSQDVNDPPLAYGGFGPYIVASPVKAGVISGNPSVCSGHIPSEIKGEASSGGSGDFNYKWQISTDNTNWIDAVGLNDALNYTPPILTASPTYYRRITTDNKHEEIYYSNVFSISIVTDGLTLCWNRNATNHNWNDPENWMDISGTALNIVPVSCSNVYIPAGITNYPSLDSINTPVGVYGLPECNNITLEYGAEFVHQHRLTYEKAHIQYNWGYYGNLSGVNYGDQPTGNASISASMMMRDKWYALAAPLKGMATGDFAFAGYPLTWQAGFSLVNPETGTAGSGIDVGDFSKTYAKNDMPLSETNNAIAVKVALYNNGLGYQNHKNLEGLQGIIEVPYFENSMKSAYYPGHIYDKYTLESKFFYFNLQTLQLLHSPVGKMRRGEEAYRFIYEENGVAPNIYVPGSTPLTVPGYKQKVKRQNSADPKVMVGNPFMAKINAAQFFNANKDKLKENSYYSLFNSENGAWEQSDFKITNYIPAYKSFIVEIKENEVELLYPLEGTYALTGTVPGRSITPDMEKGSLYLKSTNNGDLVGSYSVLKVIGSEESTANVRKMIHPEGHATPETFFIAGDNKDYNLIQAYKKGIKEVGIGVKSSDTKNQLSLTFDNVKEFYTASNLRPVLIDKYQGIKQDLTLNNTYPFKQRQSESKDNYIDANRFVLRLLSSDDALFETEMLDISIVYKDKLLEVRSIQNIREIQIYDMFGRHIHSQANINVDYYSKFLPLSQGVYVVKVYTETGKVKVKKIMVL